MGYNKPPYYLTAYGLAVMQGFKGTLEEWLASLHGDGVQLRYQEEKLQWRSIKGAEDPDPKEGWEDLLDVADIRQAIFAKAQNEADRAAGAADDAEAAKERAEEVLGSTVSYNPQTVSEQQQAQARANIGAAEGINETLEIYFDITDDGVLSLKPEYRGAAISGSQTLYPDGVSDNGVGVAGSKNSELPEVIVIPDVINDIAVTALAGGMFIANERVKSITIPSVVTTLPPYFARQAINLGEVKGTENVKVLGQGALYRTAIRKASFPNLEEMGAAGVQFQFCSYLISADLGKVTSLPKKTFNYCERLSCVYNADNVTSVGEQAFMQTKRLKNLNFLPKLTQIGANGFRCSRIDYDWATLTECTFGTNATVLQSNPTDWWSGCTYTACNTPMRSVFDQNDPRWVNSTIGNTSVTYTTGCMIVSAAMIYSAFEDKDLTSPKEFEEVVRAIDPSLMDLEVTQMSNIKAYLEAVGYTVEHKVYNAENLQAMYNALANGSLVLASADDGVSGDGWYHAVVIHGINSGGEVLVQDPSSGCVKYFDRIETTPYAIPIQNITGDNVTANGFLIVTKN